MQHICISPCVIVAFLALKLVWAFLFLALSLPSKMFGQHLGGAQRGVGGRGEGDVRENMDVGGERGGRGRRRRGRRGGERRKEKEDPPRSQTF